MPFDERFGGHFPEHFYCEETLNVCIFCVFETYHFFAPPTPPPFLKLDTLCARVKACARAKAYVRALQNLRILILAMFYVWF